MSPDIQNRGISGPRKWTDVLQKFLEKNMNGAQIMFTI